MTGCQTNCRLGFAMPTVCTFHAKPSFQQIVTNHFLDKGLHTYLF